MPALQVPISTLVHAVQTLVLLGQTGRLGAHAVKLAVRVTENVKELAPYPMDVWDRIIISSHVLLRLAR